MAPSIAKQFKGKVRDAYLDLIRKFPLTSIQSDDDLKAAQKVLDHLLGQGELSLGEQLYLDALSDLVAAYEEDHQPISPASDADMLRHLMEAKGISQAELHRGTGIAKSTISEVLAGKKPFTKRLISRLATYFHVDKGILAHNI